MIWEIPKGRAIRFIFLGLGQLRHDQDPKRMLATIPISLMTTLYRLEVAFC